MPAPRYALTQPVGDGLGFQEVVRPPLPAAGANLIVTEGGRYLSRLVSCAFTLTTSSNAANRYVTVEWSSDGTAPCSVSAAAVFVTASTTQRFSGSMYRGAAEWNSASSDLTDVLFPLSPVIAGTGWKLTIAVANIDTTDALSAIRLVYDRFPQSDQWERELAGSTPRRG